MALPPLPAQSVANVQMFGTLAGQRIITLFQYQITDTPSLGTPYTDYLQALYNQLTVANNLFDSYLDVMSVNYTLDFVRIQPVWPTRLRFVDFVRADPGAWPFVANTPNIATSIERWSVSGKRHGIGRIQLPTPSGAYANGLITDNAYKAVITTLATVMKADVPTVAPVAVWKAVILNAAIPNPVPREVNGTTPKTEVRTMHRRTVGLGI
jgi:hypothetical protein